MKYGSVCSGIEAATVAWHPLGWEPEFFSEIEAFPSAVLDHRYPSIPNHGDMTKFKEWPDATINVLVGGTPCQSFSVAGLRKGLDDPRGNLMLTFGAIASKYRPTWLLWENVPGVLSSNGGRDFGTFLGMLAELGYGFAYRVFDAQYVRVESHSRAVPQRRRRVFVVGHLGSWQRAAAVLFERESLSWDTPPRRQTGERVAPSVTVGPPFSRTGNERVESEAIVPTVANPLTARMHKGINTTLDEGQTPIPCFGIDEECNVSENHYGPLLRGGQGGTRQAVAFKANAGTEFPGMNSDDCSPTIQAENQMAVAYSAKGIVSKGNGECWESDTHMSLSAAGGGQAGQGYAAARIGMQVRRLTPTECERLQGFPDGYTDIPWRGKESSPDGPRYKALGNSMAVNVMRWLGERIQMIDGDFA